MCSSSDGKTFAALGATTGKHGTAVFGGHAGTETVVAGTFDDAGLEGTFHGGRSKMNLTRPGRKRVAILGSGEAIGNGKYQGRVSQAKSGGGPCAAVWFGQGSRGACGEVRLILNSLKRI